MQAELSLGPFDGDDIKLSLGNSLSTLEAAKASPREFIIRGHLVSCAICGVMVIVCFSFVIIVWEGRGAGVRTQCET